MTARRNAHPAARGLGTLALAVLVVLGGCGEQRAGSTAATGGDPAPSATAVPAAASLTVDLDPDGPGGAEAPRSWDLSCSEDGAVVAGDHPDAAAACAALSAAGDPWAPVAGDTACTMVYGGPQVATVRGTWAGAAVDARFRRDDGCEVARWDRLAPLLQPGAGTTAVSDAP